MFICFFYFIIKHSLQEKEMLRIFYRNFDKQWKESFKIMYGQVNSYQNFDSLNSFRKTEPYQNSDN